MVQIKSKIRVVVAKDSRSTTQLTKLCEAIESRIMALSDADYKLIWAMVDASHNAIILRSDRSQQNVFGLAEGRGSSLLFNERLSYLWGDQSEELGRNIETMADEAVQVVIEMARAKRAEVQASLDRAMQAGEEQRKRMEADFAAQRADDPFYQIEQLKQQVATLEATKRGK